MKKNLGAKICLYPTTTTLVGATVNGNPNFITIAWVGIVTFKTISLGMNKKHYTNAGIKENKTFSVNIPSEDLVVKTDYCGLVSGEEEEKSSLFDIFYGELKTAPMIKECALNIECKLFKIIELENTELFMGEIIEIYSEEKYLTNNEPDFKKIDPFIFVMPDGPYLRLGEFLAKAYEIGKTYKPK